MKKNFLIFTFSFFHAHFCLFSKRKHYKCYPTNWWVGMKWNKVQLMVHGEKLATQFRMIKMGTHGVKPATGVYLTKVNRVENQTMFFLILTIDHLQNLAKLKMFQTGWTTNILKSILN